MCCSFKLIAISYILFHIARNARMPTSTTMSAIGKSSPHQLKNITNVQRDDALYIDVELLKNATSTDSTTAI
jgi:hypothetical protein